MGPKPAAEFDVRVTTDGEHPELDGYVRDKIGSLGRLIDQPVLDARVRVIEQANPARSRPWRAQANLDVNGRLVRAQVDGVSSYDAIDLLAARLRNQLDRVAQHWGARRGRMPTGRPGEWRRESEPTPRPDYFPRPAEEREIVRRKSFTLATNTVDGAALEMDLLDYDFHLFTEQRTGQDSVLYRAGKTGYRLAQVQPVPAEQLAPFELPLTISLHPAAHRTPEEAAKRLGMLGLPFLFFVDTTAGRGSVLYRRYDGHYGLISPAG